MQSHSTLINAKLFCKKTKAWTEECYYQNRKLFGMDLT